MKFTHWLGAFLIGSGLGLYLFIFLISQNIFTSSYRAFVITSGSMEPNIPLGSVVFTKTKPSYQVGETVTFYSDSNQTNVVTHRLHALEGASFLTKGDANEDPDRLAITSGQIIGEVYFSAPYLGYLVNFAKTPKGFVAVIVIPAAIIIYEEIKTILKEIKNHLAKFFGSRGVPFTKNLSRSLLVFPVSGLLLLLVSSAGAFFTDRELSTGNILGTALDFGSPTPTPEPTASPEPTSTPTGSPSPSPSSTPIPLTKLVINEVYYDVNGRSQGGNSEVDPVNEWIEIYNPNEFEVPFKNWQICDNTSCVTVNPNVSVPSLSFALLARDASTWNFWTIPSGVEKIHSLGGTPLALANGGDRVILSNPDGVEIDRMSWGSNTTGFILGCTTICPTVPEGHSLEREPLGTDTDSAGDFTDRETPTPGS